MPRHRCSQILGRRQPALGFADNQAHQGGLAMTVETNDSESFPGIEFKADLIEQLAASVALCEVFYLQHGFWALDIVAAFL